MNANETQVPRNPTAILHSRYQDGGRHIEIVPGVGYMDLTTKALYSSGRSLLQSLTGHPKARNWRVERYFKLPPWGPGPDAEPPTLPGASILDIFGHTPRPLGSTGLTLDRQGIVRLRDAPGLTVAPRRFGIDLVHRAKEVQKLLFHGFGYKIFAQGYDPADVLQEVFKGILARNNGTCAWDESKSSFGHYVHMVCGCVLANYHRREQRRRAVEQVGLTVPLGQEMDVCDAVATMSSGSFWGGGRQDIPAWAEQDLVAHLLRREAGPIRGSMALRSLAARLIPLVRQGMSRIEMAEAVGETKANVGRALAYLKSRTLDWARP